MARLVAAGADLDAVEILGDVEGVDDEGQALPATLAIAR